ncbi:MAG: type II toxin-antitoxin system HicA family toxin [Gammaproteobacteria bacterium]|nr:type II toxin-antitoxin system HicA family toxin [Gammaproteobacteria bacterium]
MEREGWIKTSGKGDHHKYKHPERPGHVVVPHPRKDLPAGTLRNIYRQAGWPWR